MKFGQFIAAFALVDSAQAWWGKAHLRVARIAYDLLQKESPDVLDKATAILKKMENYETKKHEKNYPFVECATYGDDFKYHGGIYQKEWHFIDQPYIDNGKTINDYPNFKPADQTVVGALQGLVNYMNNQNASDDYTNAVKKETHGGSDAQYSTALRLIIHYVGDIHQPLHATSRVDDEYPTGDFGGNAVKLPSKEGASNLHAVWDSVGYIYAGYSQLPYSTSGWEEVGSDSDKLVAKYPLSSLGYDVTNLDPKQWAKESLEVSQKTVYTGVKSQTALSDQYISDAVDAAERRVVAGGFRLANLMKSLTFAESTQQDLFLN